MNKYKLYTLSELYKFTKGTNKLNKTIINQNKGTIPVYSGQSENEGIIGYTDKARFENDNGKVIKYIRIITVGNAGMLNVISTPFSLAQNNGVLIPINKNVDYSKIDLNFVIYQLKNKLSKLAVGEGKQKSLLKKNIDEVKISIPILSDGEPDIDKQQEMIDKFKKVENRLQTLKEDKIRLLKTNIQIDFQYTNHISLTINEIFDLSIPTNGSKFTKGFVQANPGNIPVYGATRIENEVGYGYISDNAEIKEVKNEKVYITKVQYFENCLTYNIDASAGFVFYRKGKFSLSEKVRPLVIKNKYKDILDPEYLKIIIQPIFRANIRGRKGPNGENEFTKIGKTIIQDLQIPIPIEVDGTINLKKQKEIAEQYKKLESIKQNLYKYIDNILKINIDI